MRSSGGGSMSMFGSGGGGGGWYASAAGRICSSQCSRRACTAPSMPAGSPTQRLRLPQAIVAWCPTAAITHLAMSLLMTSPTPTGLTPGFLSRATSRQAMRALIAAQGGWLFAIHSVRLAMVSLSWREDAPNRKSQFCKSTASVPLGPPDPDSFETVFATNSDEMVRESGSGTSS